MKRARKLAPAWHAPVMARCAWTHRIGQRAHACPHGSHPPCPIPAMVVPPLAENAHCLYDRDAPGYL